MSCLSSFLEIEKQTMKLKFGQYPNGRCLPAVQKCKMLTNHPRSYEPPYHCGEESCLTCEGLALGRRYINDCYAFQHRENSRTDIQGEAHDCFSINNQLKNPF